MRHPYFHKEPMIIACLLFLVSNCSSNKFARSESADAATYSKEFKQINYKDATIEINQGQAPVSVRTVGKHIPEKLDLLVVIDNSPSMVEEQIALSEKLQILLSEVSSEDWQMAIITTDNGIDKCFRGLINKETPNYIEAFEAAIKAGDRGSMEEWSFRNATHALTGLCAPAENWLREGSSLAVLFVSDEDDCSLGNCSDLIDWKTNFKNALVATRKIGESVRVYGLINDPEMPCDEAMNISQSLNTIILETKGKKGRICDTDFTNTLKAISENMADLVKTKITLSEEPNAQSLQILVNGENYLNYTKNGLDVVFNDEPPAQATIETLYQTGGNDFLEPIIAIPKNARIEELKIEINTAIIPFTDFIINTNTREIILKNTIPEKAIVKISYKESQALKKTFFLAINAEPSSISIARNSFLREPPDFEYDRTTGQITLTPPPPVGSHFHITYKQK